MGALGATNATELRPSDVPASITGRWVLLRAVSREDLPAFFRWRVDVFEMHLWASSKRVPTFEEFATELDQMLRQTITFLTVNKQTGQPIGFVQAYNLNLNEGWCYALVYTAPRYRRGHGVEAYVGLLDYLFRSFNLRKIYADVFEFNADSMSPLMSAGFVEEGRFRQHVWFEKQYWDVIRFAIYRDDWYRFRERTHFVLGVAEEAADLLEQQAERDGKTVTTT